MANVKVCDGQWNGVKNGRFTWTNDDPTNDVIISQDGTNTWPFNTTSHSLTVPKKSGGPGTLPCQLISTPGTYTYNSVPCPILGNPKTVIIT